jgi:ribonuclease VapC
VIVLDASTLLALLNNEAGADTVARHVGEEALMSSVNLAEVASKLSDYGIPNHDIRSIFMKLGLRIIPFSESQALTSGVLRKQTRQADLSLGDRACLSLAPEYSVTAVTADRNWRGTIEVPIEFIR